VTGQLSYSIDEADDLGTTGLASLPPDIKGDEFSLVFPDDDARPNVYARVIGKRVVLVLLFALAGRLDEVRASTTRAAELIDFVLRTAKWEPGRC